MDQGTKARPWWHHLAVEQLWSVVAAAMELHGSPKRDGFELRGKWACIERAVVGGVVLGQPVAVFDGGAWQYEGVVSAIGAGASSATVVTSYDSITGLHNRLGTLGPDLPPLPGSQWCHVARGNLVVVDGYTRLQLGPGRCYGVEKMAGRNALKTYDGVLSVVYREVGGSLIPWTRPLWEFMDGRFVTIVDRLVQAQYDPEVHRSNTAGRYPICIPPLGRRDGDAFACVCPRCGQAYESDRTCPAVAPEDRWGPEED